jgi:DNA-binding response OmpR family regulator
LIFQIIWWWSNNIDTKKEIILEKNIVLNLDNQTIIKNNKIFNLSKKEFEVLLYLYNNRVKNISIDEFINNIWSYEDNIEASTLRTYIKNLRKILGDNMILNIRGVGYKLNIK